jgi:ketosteroid isomerase-like protein
LVVRFSEAFDNGDIDLALSLAAAELELIDPGLGTVQGTGPFREYLETLKRAVPDATAEIEHVHDAGDTVIVEGRPPVRGRHHGARWADRLVSHLLRPTGAAHPARIDGRRLRR